MARGKRTDIETKAKIISDKISNPDLSTRDLSEQYGVGKSTIADIIDEIPEELRTSSDKGEKILATMDEIIDGIADITRLAINPIRDKVIANELTVGDLKALNDIAKNNFDRRQLLTGEATSNDKVTIKWQV